MKTKDFVYVVAFYPEADAEEMILSFSHTFIKAANEDEAYYIGGDFDKMLRLKYPKMQFLNDYVVSLFNYIPKERTIAPRPKKGKQAAERRVRLDTTVAADTFVWLRKEAELRDISTGALVDALMDKWVSK